MVRPFLPCLIFAFAALAGAQQPNSLTPQEKAAGWTLLFDGRSFAGWTPSPSSRPALDSFSIEDGAIVARKDPKFREDIETASQWSDFELVFDWKISPAGNSGVKYRVQDAMVIHPSLIPPDIRKFERQADYALSNRKATRATMPVDGKGQIYQVAFEYQVIDNDAHSDARTSKKSWAGALYQMLEPSENPAKPVGQWNTARIIVRGDQVQHWLNGRKVIDATLADPAVTSGIEKRWGTASPVYKLLTSRPRKSGPIVLQNHNDPAWFRNIKIRALK